MELSEALRNAIIDFLKTLPNINDTKGRQAFIYASGIDSQLADQIPVDEPPAQFIPILLLQLEKYGKLKNEQYAIEAVLETTKKYIGQDKRMYCDMLIQDFRDSMNLRKQANRIVSSITIQEIDVFDVSRAIASIEICDVHLEVHSTEQYESLIITFNLVNKTQQRFEIWIEASILDKNWKGGKDLRLNKTIILESGQYEYIRELRIPKDLPTGEYNLCCTVWVGSQKSVKGPSTWSDTFYILHPTGHTLPRIYLLEEEQQLGKAVYSIQECSSLEHGTKGKNRRYVNGSIYLIEEKGTLSSNKIQIGEYFRVRDSEIGRRYEHHYCGTGSELGFPISEETDGLKSEYGDKKDLGFFQKFENGAIYRSEKSGARAVFHNSIGRKFREYEERCQQETGKTLVGGRLGFPTTEQYEIPSEKEVSKVVQKFQYGCIVQYESEVYGVNSKIYEIYNTLGLWNSKLGFPIDDETAIISNVSKAKGSIQHFEGGCILWNDEIDKGFFIDDKIYVKWRQEQRKAGFPINSSLVMGHYSVQYFEGGLIKAHGSDGTPAFFEPKQEITQPQPMRAVALEHGAVIQLKCEDANKHEVWLSGDPTSKPFGTVSLVGEPRDFSTWWEVFEVGNRIYSFRNMSNTFGPKWLDGFTEEGTVSLVPEMNERFNGTRWRIFDVAERVYLLKCMGTDEGSRWLSRGKLQHDILLAHKKGTQWIQSTVLSSQKHYFIISKHSQKCLDLSGGSNKPGTHVIQWEKHGADHQLWRFVPRGERYFRIVSKHNNELCLDVDGGSKDDSALAIVWEWHEGDNQQWELIQQDDGSVVIQARHSNKCLDVKDRETENGGDIQQYEPSNVENQKWILIPEN